MSKTSGSAKNENLSTALLSKHLVSVINCKHWDCKIRCSQIVPVTLGSQKKQRDLCSLLAKYHRFKKCSSPNSPAQRGYIIQSPDPPDPGTDQA